MTECREAAARMAAFVDGALPDDERHALERHLERCPPCRVAAAVETACRSVLRARAAALRHPAVPVRLRARCESLAVDIGGWNVRRFIAALAAAAVAVAAGLAVFGIATDRFDTLLAAQLTADHAACFRFFAPTVSGGADAEQIEALLARQYGWDVHVPPSSVEAGVELVGARRCVYARGAIPHLMYRAGGRDVSLYILEGITREPADLLAVGHRSRVWSRGATTYVLVWPAAAGELVPAVEYLVSEAR
jgi:anti-sigma factor (TIGR02949 family)